MRFSQDTLFDLAPGDIESPPLVRVADEVYEVSMRIQLDARSGDLACAIQVKSAITDELMHWTLRTSPDVQSDVDPWVDRRLAEFLNLLSAYRCPF